MDVTFGNPLGFLGLLGVPAVLVIHFFQRRSQVVTVTTLFLLEQMRRESVSGRRFERLRSSVPLWLQLAAVLLLTWVLAQPRWLRRETVQKVAVVLDASSSMAVFRPEAARRLRERLEPLQRRVAATEYVLLDTNLQTSSLYHGTGLEPLLAELERWEPQLGAHDFAPALRVARGLVGREGLVVLVSDHLLDPVPYEGRLLAVGAPVDNAGFAGLTVEEGDGGLFWRTLVRNYGTEAQEPTWWIEAGGNRTAARPLRIEPGAVVVLEGAFAPEAETLTLALEGDAFPLDDRLPVVRPRPKALTVAHGGDEKFRALHEQIFASFENVVAAGNPGEADVQMVRFDPLEPALPGGNAFVFVDDPLAAETFVEGRLVAEDDPLVSGLNWQAFVCRNGLQMPAGPSDAVLLWQGERPMIFLRPAAGGQQLIFNFDVNRSNAPRLPAFVVLVHRFLERIRSGKVGLEWANYETGQEIRLAVRREAEADPVELQGDAASGGVRERIPADRLRTLSLPRRPGFFEVSQGGETLLRGAVHFADTREADLRQADSADRLGDLEARMISLHRREDAVWRVWVLLALLALLGSWWFARGTAASRAGRAPAVPEPVAG